VDERLRELQRRAEAGDPEAREALDGAIRRLGGGGAEFRAPRVVPPLVGDYSDPVLYSVRHDIPVGWYSSPASRRLTRLRSHRQHRGRVRKALRGSRPEEWDDL